MSVVLFIDDDLKHAAQLATHLETEGFAVHIESETSRGIAEALSGHYAIVVLDVVTPRLNGFEALRRIRSQSALPVLILTAHATSADRITGLELGADDYVAKPCAPRELAARIRAILRRTQPVELGARSVNVLISGHLTLWPEQRRAEWRGTSVPLTSTEFRLLEMLLRHGGRPVSKGELSQYALGRPHSRNDRCIDVHLSSMRRKLRTHAEGRSLIRAEHGRGYRLLEQ